MHYPPIQGNNRRLEHLQEKGLPIVASSKRTDHHGKSQENFNSVSTNSGRSAFGFYFAGQPSLSSRLKQTARPAVRVGSRIREDGQERRALTSKNTLMAPDRWMLLPKS